MVPPVHPVAAITVVPVAAVAVIAVVMGLKMTLLMPVAPLVAVAIMTGGMGQCAAGAKTGCNGGKNEYGGSHDALLKWMEQAFITPITSTAN